MKSLLTVVSASLLVFSAGCHDSSAPVSSDQAVAVSTVVVGESISPQTLSLAGVVAPHLEADLSSQILAPIVLVAKREGDHFRKGELLVRLSAPALDAEAARAAAILESGERQERVTATQAELAANNLSRYTQLRERRSVTSYELDQVRAQRAAAEAQHESAVAQVAAARAALAAQQAHAADINLHAPFDGIVSRRMVDPGAMATPGLPLLHLQATADKEVEFSVPENLLSTLHLGGAVSVSSGRGPTVSAKLIEISPAGDSSSHSFLVKASLPASGSWNTGSVVQVKLPSQASVKDVTIPSHALLQQGGLDSVLVIAPDGRAVVRYVTLGASTTNSVQVLTGLDSGERIVSTPNLALAGKKIEARP